MRVLYIVVTLSVGHISVCKHFYFNRITQFVFNIKLLLMISLLRSLTSKEKEDTYTLKMLYIIFFSVCQYECFSFFKNHIVDVYRFKHQFRKFGEGSIKLSIAPEIFAKINILYNWNTCKYGYTKRKRTLLINDTYFVVTRYFFSNNI